MKKFLLVAMLSGLVQLGYSVSLKKFVKNATEEVKTEVIKKAEEVKKDISERDVKIDISEEGIKVKLEAKPIPAVETPKPVETPKVIAKPIVKPIVKPAVIVKTSADIKPVKVEQPKSNFNVILIAMIVFIVIIAIAMLLMKWNKKIILLLIMAGSMFSGCVSIKARVLAEKQEVPRYQLEATYTIFQIGK